VFDNQILAEILWVGGQIAEISCPTHYFAEASGISFQRSIVYGWGCLWTGLSFRLATLGLHSSSLFPAETRDAVGAESRTA
jgi:hypothetical protein